MANQEVPDIADIEIAPLGWGCLASAMTSCLSVGIMGTLLFGEGIQLTRAAVERVPAQYQFIGMALGLIGNILVGYVTASTARRAKVLHTVILTIILLLLGVVTLVVPSNSSSQGEFMIVALVFTIPAMLFGACAQSDATRAAMANRP